MRPFIFIAFALFPLPGSGISEGSGRHPGPDRIEKAQVVIRADDIGFSHSVNMAVEKVAEAGIPLSVSVLTPCPWFEEGIEMLKMHPEVTVGVHLALFSEWKGYRWGPVLGQKAVPSLVDGNGYFFYSIPTLVANNPQKEEIEMEFRAQIERALNSGLRISYIDAHLGSTKESREVMVKLSKEYGLPISGAFDQGSLSTYSVPFERKKEADLEMVGSLEPGKSYLWVIHLGVENPEICALEEIRENRLPDMCKHRSTQLKTLLSPEFREAVEKYNVELITYGEFFGTHGPEAMDTRGYIER